MGETISGSDAIVLALLRKRLRVGVVGARAEQPGLLAVPGDALAA